VAVAGRWRLVEVLKSARRGDRERADVEESWALLGPVNELVRRLPAESYLVFAATVDDTVHDPDGGFRCRVRVGIGTA